MDTGFLSLDKVYSIKEGSYTCILAAPHHGKSEFSFELAFNAAHKYGVKSLVCSPETGSVEDVYAEFIHKYTGRRIFKNCSNPIEDKMYYAALNHIDAMYSIVDCDEKSFSLPDLFGMVTDEKMIIGDPWNELNHSKMSEFGTRQDLYIEDLMGEVRRYNKKYKKHTIITLHPSSQKQLLYKENDKDPGKFYYGMPNAREAAGGQALFRKAMCWINLWRPPTFIKTEVGPYPDNVIIGNVEKAKPKGVATKGNFYLYFDWKRNRYYEDINGSRAYAFEHADKEKKYEGRQLQIIEDAPF